MICRITIDVVNPKVVMDQWGPGAKFTYYQLPMGWRLCGFDLSSERNAAIFEINSVTPKDSLSFLDMVMSLLKEISAL